MEPAKPLPPEVMRRQPRTAEAAEKATVAKLRPEDRSSAPPVREHRDNDSAGATVPATPAPARIVGERVERPHADTGVAAPAVVGRSVAYKAPNEVHVKSAASAPAPPAKADVRKAKVVSNLASTSRLRESARASDALARANYAQLGDRVEIDGDTVAPLDRQDHHQFIYDHGLQAQQGRVIGTKIEGGIFFMQVETPNSAAWVPAECVRVIPDVVSVGDAPPRKAPERMRKVRDGSYNRT